MTPTVLESLSSAMSEDDATALEQAVEEQLAAEREAFFAGFPPEAFRGIATALKVRPTPENLSRLRGWLLPDFHFCLDVRHRYKEPTREEQIKLLQKLAKAASSLHSTVTNFDINFCLPLALLAPDEGGLGVTDHFVATLQLLANTAANEVEKPASRRSGRGRPRKNEPFRQLTPRLIRKYERLTNEPAGRPNWLPDDGRHGRKGSFYPFAVAVWFCLRKNLPAEALAAIPSTEIGLGEELKKHWPKNGPSR
jgi:hypothetical protein